MVSIEFDTPEWSLILDALNIYSQEVSKSIANHQHASEIAQIYTERLSDIQEVQYVIQTGVSL